MSTDDGWLDADEQAAWRGWLDTYRLLIPVLDRQLQVSKVSFTEYEVLVCLSETTDLRLRMSEVADRTLATRSAITRTVDRLVARGWVRRVKSLQDQRGAYAQLTESGARALAGLAPGHVKAVRDNLIDLLTPAELDALRCIGAKVKHRLAGRDGWSPRTFAGPDPAEEIADGIGADQARSDLADSDLADSDLADSDLADPDLADPDLADPDLADPDRQQPAPADPNPADPNLAPPEQSGAGLAAPDTTEEDVRVTTGPDR